MKKGDLSHWLDISSCSNLLFFSQLVNELLFDPIESDFNA